MGCQLFLFLFFFYINSRLLSSSPVTTNNGGWGEPPTYMEEYACMFSVHVYACVCLIRCVLEQVIQVGVLLLCGALWARCERCHWMAGGGLPVAMGGRQRAEGSGG